MPGENTGAMCASMGIPVDPNAPERKTHHLKIDEMPMADLVSGRKTGEVRRDDRGFSVGDDVILSCTTGKTASATYRITHIQRGYGLPDDLCVLSYGDATPAPQDGYSAGVRAAAEGMRRIVEEIDGAMRHGTWRDERGMRLKDTPEWVALYNALAAAPALPDARAGAVEPVALTSGQMRDAVMSGSLTREQDARWNAAPPTPACTATDGPASACVYRAPGLGTAATFERG